MKKTITVLMIALSVLTFSCGDTVEGIKNGVAAASASVGGGDLLSNAETLKQAEADLKAMPKFKDKEVMVFQNVQFHGMGKIMIELQDPENPKNIDHYEWSGSWSGPQPVQISGDGNMKANLTPLNDIKFETVAKIYNTWMEKAKTIEGAEEKTLDFVSFSLWVPNQTRRWITSDIEGSREEYSIDFNLDGSIKEFEKN